MPKPSMCREERLKDLPSIFAASAKSGSELSQVHIMIKEAAAANPGEKVESFGYLKAAQYAVDRYIFEDQAFIHQYKAYYVHGKRRPIKAAAAVFDIPAILLAGVVYNEVGGKDPIKPTVYEFRKALKLHADETSLGPVSLQVRRAVTTLGYDPKNVTPKMEAEIIATLLNDDQEIFVAAKHLSELRNVDFRGKGASALNNDDLAVVGARYNQGPDAPRSKLVKAALDYGNTIVRRKDELAQLLTDAPVRKPVWKGPIDRAEDAGRRAIKSVEDTLDGIGKALEREVERQMFPPFGAP